MSTRDLIIALALVATTAIAVIAIAFGSPAPIPGRSPNCHMEPVIFTRPGDSGKVWFFENFIVLESHELVSGRSVVIYSGHKQAVEQEFDKVIAAIKKAVCP